MLLGLSSQTPGRGVSCKAVLGLATRLEAGDDKTRRDFCSWKRSPECQDNAALTFATLCWWLTDFLPDIQERLFLKAPLRWPQSFMGLSLRATKETDRKADESPPNSPCCFCETVSCCNMKMWYFAPKNEIFATPFLYAAEHFMGLYGLFKHNTPGTASGSGCKCLDKWCVKMHVLKLTSIICEQGTVNNWFQQLEYGRHLGAAQPQH